MANGRRGRHQTSWAATHGGSGSARRKTAGRSGRNKRSSHGGRASRSPARYKHGRNVRGGERGYGHAARGARQSSGGRRRRTVSHTWEILSQTRGIFAKTGNRAQVRWPVIGSRAQQKKTQPRAPYDWSTAMTGSAVRSAASRDAPSSVRHSRNTVDNDDEARGTAGGGGVSPSTAVTRTRPSCSDGGGGRFACRCRRPGGHPRTGSDGDHGTMVQRCGGGRRRQAVASCGRVAVRAVAVPAVAAALTAATKERRRGR